MEVYNPYEIQSWPWVIMLYNKDTGEYEWFGERIKVWTLDGELMFDGDVSSWVHLNKMTYPGYAIPQGVPALGSGFVYGDGTIERAILDVKMIVFKNGIEVSFEGTLFITMPPM